MSNQDPKSDPEQAWEHGWDGHSHAQRMRLARLPMIEKLRWLEEAERLANTLAKAEKTPVRED
jgi:hypothetical protein